MPDLLTTFAEAVEAIRRRIVITDDELAALTTVSADWAFWAAGLAQLRMVQDLLDSLAAAVRRGTGLDAWKRRLPALLREAWGRGSAFRLETIYRNAVQHAFSRGRYKQMSHPAVKRYRPYWLFDAVEDARTTPICRDRDRIIREADDPWWLSNYPPLHHRCRSGVRTLRASQARRMGITTDEQLAEMGSLAQDGFGQAPAGPPQRQADMSGIDSGLIEIQAAKVAAP
jgi:SPP1 gp7 family putative phage head morphogenesis protein